MRTIETDVLILGGGVAGLALASALGSRATVLEKEPRPGGLVRTECFDGYWFDRVLHLLYVRDEGTLSKIHEMMPGVLAPCPPTAYVETAAGTVRFPFQMHLAGLSMEAKVACIADFAERCPRESRPANYEEMLLASFGRGMCETFFFPYNRKMWRRPLDELAPNGFHWNIATPTLEEVLRGSLDDATHTPVYNENGWYPRPPAESPVCGMELLSQALAGQVCDLRTGHEVVSIDPAAKTVTAISEGARVTFRYQTCVSTLPLPWTLALCKSCPEGLRRRLSALPYNSVISAAFCVQGPRPEPRGLWRYYTDERVSFTRLIHMHEFDPGMAPEDGWGLMAEIPCRSEEAAAFGPGDLERVRRELDIVGAIPDDCRVVGKHIMRADAAYVVFTPSNRPVVEEATRFLRESGIEPLGRYGRWEYSSMAQVIRDGFDLAAALGAE